MGHEQRERASGSPGLRMSAAAALLARLKALGVEYVFANSGTDFPALIEALADPSPSRLPMPEAIAIPHEHCAMGMAHGYYLATGRPQAVMAHTNVGLANCILGAINAAAERIPMFVFSGRTPVTEHGRFGSRSIPIGWGQEMRDQHALIRELVKWDYELRVPEQVAELLDRAAAIALSTPRGPVYMSLPRETLGEEADSDKLTAPSTIAPARTAPTSVDTARAVELLAQAKSPVIFTQGGAGSSDAFDAVSAMAERWAIPVVHYWATQLLVPTSHPMYAGTEPQPWLGEADVIVLVDALAPWAPDANQPQPDCRIVQLGPDPLFQRFPVRGYASDVTLAGETSETILALAAALAAMTPPARIDKRRRQVSEATAEIRRSAHQNADRGAHCPMTKSWVARCVSEVIARRPDAAVLSELGVPLAGMAVERHGCWYQAPNAGGLGWGFPTALGLQLADRGRLVVATMGDGSYMFANPAVCHQVAESLRLPVLAVILNNAEWGAVRTATSALYPSGHAMASNAMPLTSLEPQPDFATIARASRARAERIEDPADLPRALADAVAHIEATGQQALIDVVVAR